MVLSMTGFGAASGENTTLKVEVEIKSLNSKFLDLGFRLPRLIQPFEMDLRNSLAQKVKRGKVQFSVTLEILQTQLAKKSINNELFAAYKKDIDLLAEENQLDKSDVLQIILNLPDVLEGQEMDGDEEVKKLLLDTTNAAIEKLIEFRKQEGENLSKELTQYAGEIKRVLDLIDAQKDKRIERMRKRLLDLQEKYLTSEQKDSNRMEQELIFYIERFDITEEIVRLTGHIAYFLKELNGEGSGKKLGFISQEMGREINTIGSKANDEEIQHHVVNMKDNLEKIKEQSLNLL